MIEKEAIAVIKRNWPYQRERLEPLRGALTLAIEALEKQVPKEPTAKGLDAKTGDWTIDCPNCEARTQGTRMQPNYCANCGQKIEWSDSE